MEINNTMKKVGSYDQYQRVLEEDGVTVLHNSSGCNIDHYVDLSNQDAVLRAKTLFEATKALGSFEVKKEQESNGYYEILVEMSDKRQLYRTIYVY